jgi:hypothetical protein
MFMNRRRHHAARYLLAAAGATAVLTGVAGGPATASESTPQPANWRRCTNTIENFSIGYPHGWYTTQIRPAEACHQFHPDRFTIPLESEYPLTALNARPVSTLPSRTDTDYERVLRWEPTTVGGRPAVRFETSSTGEGQYLAGTRQYGYVIHLRSGLISVHTTAEPDETRYAAWTAVVDDAARTVRQR